MDRIRRGMVWARPRWGLALLAAYALAYLSWQLVHWLPFEQPLAGDLLLLPIGFVAAYLAWRASVRCAASARLRRAWWWIALAFAGQALGGVAQLVYEYVARDPAYPSVADAFYLSFYPLMLIGVLSFPALRRSGRQALELLLDCAIVAAGGSALVVYLVLGPEAVGGLTPLEALVTLAYPAGDLVLLVALGAAVLRGPLPTVRVPLRWLAAAIGLFIVGDLIFGYEVLHGGYEGGDPVDTAYFLAFLCFVAAAASQRPVTADVITPRLRETSASRLPYLAVAACMAILLFEELDHPFLPDLGVALIATLVTALVVARQLLSFGSLRQSQLRLAQAQELSQLGSWEWEIAKDRLEISSEGARILGIDTGPTRSFGAGLEMIHPAERATFERRVEDALVSGAPFTSELRIVRPDGELRSLHVRAEVDMKGDRPVCLRGTHQDITDRKRMETQLQYQADHDPLTGLFNRRRFAVELDRIMRYAARYGRSGAMLMLDVDNFKFLNDARGHAAGDAMLKGVAAALSERARETDVVARLGGDEFAIVLPEADEAEAREVAEHLRASVAASVGGELIHLSVGIAFFNGDDLIADDVLVAADIALYDAKEAGKDRVRVYSGEGSAAITWVERIRAALAEDRFVLFAQPMIDVESGRTTHKELLIRMLADDGDVIPPSAFLPTAERFGLSNEIDRWVVAEALRLARDGERVSINLSAPSIGDEQILAAVRSSIRDGVQPADLIFEVTETAAMTNMAAARDFAEALHRLGCSVALDDFGTGFGSFTYLKHLPTRFLKIDMEFVREMVTNPTDRQVVKSITDVAHSLGKETVAEGVEDPDTLRALRAYGVDCAQGFFIGRPERISPPTAFERALGSELAIPEAGLRTANVSG